MLLSNFSMSHLPSFAEGSKFRSNSKAYDSSKNRYSWSRIYLLKSVQCCQPTTQRHVGREGRRNTYDTHDKDYKSTVSYAAIIWVVVHATLLPPLLGEERRVTTYMRTKVPNFALVLDFACTNTKHNKLQASSYLNHANSGLIKTF